MAKLNIQIEAPVTAFNKYADELGYTSEVRNNDATGFVPNPESKQTFLARRIKEIVAESLARYSAVAVERQKQQEYRTERENLETAIKSVTTITFTP